MRNFSAIRSILLTGAAASLAACAMPRHQDAVFFGTDTKVAFDVGVQPENGNTPSVTLGYKRREFVYMPLAEYGPSAQPGLLEAIVVGDAFRKKNRGVQPQTETPPPPGPGGRETNRHESEGSVQNAAYRPVNTTNPSPAQQDTPHRRYHSYQGQGEKVHQKDSYSVFATFGGNFTGGGSGGGAKIKQVFATGIAAQIAAKEGQDYVNPQAANAVIAEKEAQLKAERERAQRLEGDLRTLERETLTAVRTTNPTIRLQKDGAQSRVDQLTGDQAEALYVLIEANKTDVPVEGLLRGYLDAQAAPGDGDEAKELIKALIELSDFSDPGISEAWAKILQ